MYPAQPPFPTASNFPFHLSTGGSQSSMLISESFDGFNTATTRQCAGATMGSGGLAAGSAGAGAGAGVVTGAFTGSKTPSATSSALVIVALENWTFFNPSHG